MVSKKLAVLVFFVLLLSMAFATDYNYSKNVLVPVDVNMTIDANAGVVTIQSATSFNSFSTGISRTQKLTMTQNYNVTQNDCPNFSQMIDPINAQLQASGLNDLNSIIDYFKDTNSNNSSCLEIMQSNLTDLKTYVANTRVDTQDFMLNTFIPYKQQVDDLNDNYHDCLRGLAATQGEYDLEIARTSLADKNTGICTTNMASAQEFQDNSIAVLLIVLVFSVILNFIFIAEKQGLFKNFRVKK